jgi:ribosomal protein L1
MGYQLTSKSGTLISIKRLKKASKSNCREAQMNEDTFNMEIRKFLKQVGVTSQREIEHAVQRAIDSGKIKGTESLDVTMTLAISNIDLNYTINGKIGLEKKG